MMKKQRIFITTVLLFVALWGSPRGAAAQIFAVRADALAALTGTLHLGTEVSVADKWSVEASGYWNPVKSSSLSMNFHAVQIGGQLSYVGYDLGSRTSRYNGRAYGIGISYGYAWMLSKRWFVTLEAGLGVYYTKDTRRDPTVGDWDDEYIYHYRRWTLAPSRLEVSFSYLF